MTVIFTPWRTGFCQGLSVVALTQACNITSVYVSWNHVIKTPVTIQTSQERVTKRALLDSGATESFIHSWLAKELTLFTYRLEKPRQVCNVDGTNNQLRRVTKEAKFQVFHESHCQTHWFLIVDIGEDDIILGYPFFKATNPMVDWPTSKVHGTLVLTEVWPAPIPYTHLSYVTRIIEAIKKTNVAQQLAIEVSDKQEKTWQELVLQQYHKFRASSWKRTLNDSLGRESGTMPLIWKLMHQHQLTVESILYCQRKKKNKRSSSPKT